MKFVKKDSTLSRVEVTRTFLELSVSEQVKLWSALELLQRIKERLEAAGYGTSCWMFDAGEVEWLRERYGINGFEVDFRQKGIEDAEVAAIVKKVIENDMDRTGTTRKKVGGDSVAK